MKQKMINFLLSNANPSIRLRVKKELLMDFTAAEEQKLQNEILQEKIISLIAQKQLPSGWIGLGFHGSNKNAGQYDNQEVATKYMGEKGLSGTELLNRAMDAFATTELNNHCYAGKYYSEYDTPAYGQNTIRCACISRAHYDDIIDIEPLINIALESFLRVTQVDSIFDVSRPTKKCRLFNSGERWPCRYHLETLAFSPEKWKNKENISMLAESFRHLLRTDRPEIINTPVACWVGHAVGPLWYLNEGYSISGDGMNHQSPDKKRRVNFEKTEWLARCGLYPYLPQLKEEVDYILSQVDSDGICRAETYEGEFRGWSPYFGLQLETDWRSKLKKSCDFTFCALLIAHYAGL